MEEEEEVFCPVCSTPIEIFEVYTIAKTFKKVKQICLTCKEKEQKHERKL
jgi:hypothetical protein|tara:strand:+ start:692 stop:841 length:150 start_codon:yes stop_codon:yes gene_type:complete